MTQEHIRVKLSSGDWMMAIGGFFLAPMVPLLLAFYNFAKGQRSRGRLYLVVLGLQLVAQIVIFGQMEESIRASKNEAHALATRDGGRHYKNQGDVGSLRGIGPADAPDEVVPSSEYVRIAPVLSPTLGAQQANAKIDALSEQARRAVAEQKRLKAETGFMGYYDRNTLLGAAVSRTMDDTFHLSRQLSGDLDNTPDPAHAKWLRDNWAEATAGLVEDDMDAVLETKNKKMYEAQLFRMGERRENEAVMGRASAVGRFMVQTIAAGLRLLPASR